MDKFYGINLDITYLCSLKCAGCARQRYTDGLNGFENHVTGGPVPGKHMSMEEMDVVSDYFQGITFCGTHSDPQFHPQFHEFLQMCVDKKKTIQVHVAATARKSSWFTKAFQISKGHDVEWIFGIDGKPEDSHIYRKNQDGKFLYNMMIRCASMGIKTTWHYIIFNYNEHYIEECARDAERRNISFVKIESCRWWTEELLQLKPNTSYVDEDELGKKRSVSIVNNQSRLI